MDRECDYYIINYFCTTVMLTVYCHLLDGSILLNIHEVWPRPFWGGSSHQKKTLWIISLVMFLLPHWKVIRGQIK